jgi:hypothetical protein
LPAYRRNKRKRKRVEIDTVRSSPSSAHLRPGAVDFLKLRKHFDRDRRRHTCRSSNVAFGPTRASTAWSIISAIHRKAMTLRFLGMNPRLILCRPR